LHWVAQIIVSASFGRLFSHVSLLFRKNKFKIKFKIKFYIYIYIYIYIALGMKSFYYCSFKTRVGRVSTSEHTSCYGYGIFFSTSSYPPGRFFDTRTRVIVSMLYQGSTLVPAQHWFKPPNKKPLFSKIMTKLDEFIIEKKKLSIFLVGKVTKFCWINTLLVIFDVNLIVSHFHLTPSWHLIDYIFLFIYISFFFFFFNRSIKIWMSSKWVLTIISNFLTCKANKIIFTLFFIYL
jgi:hypothetical protein